MSRRLVTSGSVDSTIREEKTTTTTTAATAVPGISTSSSTTAPAVPGTLTATTTGGVVTRMGSKRAKPNSEQPTGVKIKVTAGKTAESKGGGSNSGHAWRGNVERSLKDTKADNQSSGVNPSTSVASTVPKGKKLLTTLTSARSPAVSKGATPGRNLPLGKGELKPAKVSSTVGKGSREAQLLLKVDTKSGKLTASNSTVVSKMLTKKLSPTCVPNPAIVAPIAQEPKDNLKRSGSNGAGTSAEAKKKEGKTAKKEKIKECSKEVGQSMTSLGLDSNDKEEVNVSKNGASEIHAVPRTHESRPDASEPCDKCGRQYNDVDEVEKKIRFQMKAVIESMTESHNKQMNDLKAQCENANRKLEMAKSRHKEKVCKLEEDLRGLFEGEAKRLTEVAKRSEENLNGLLNSANADIDSLKEQLAEKTAELEERKKEWEQSQKDYLLCIRAAERFRSEAETMLKESGLDPVPPSLGERTQSAPLIDDDAVNLADISDSVIDAIIEAACSNIPLVRGDSVESTPMDDLQVMSTGTEGTNAVQSRVEETGSTLRDSTKSNIAIDKTAEPVGQIGDVLTSRQLEPTAGTSIRPEIVAGDDDVGAINKENSPKMESSATRTGSLRENEKLQSLRKDFGGSLRNALLKWCQDRVNGYRFVDITNFSTSWKDGIALCALLHSLQPSTFPVNYDTLRPDNPTNNFRVAQRAATAMGLKPFMSVADIITSENPSWETILSYVSEIYTSVENV